MKVCPLEGDARLGYATKQLVDLALRQEVLLVSAVAFWEAAMLSRRQHSPVPQSVANSRLGMLNPAIT
jgi:PIN domain nuclease of toxin-antitoxin system